MAEPRTRKKADMVLITGFPRLLSKGLARKALNARPRRTIVLLTTHSERDAGEKWAATLTTADRRHLKVVVGNPDSTDAGLSGREVKNLQANLTHIFHADVEPTGPHGDPNIYLANLNRLIMLARSCVRFERFCFFSTAFISGDRSGTICAEELEMGQTLRTPFERYMMKAERIIRASMPRLPMTVFRPSSMIGHSQTGDAHGLTEGPSYLLSLMLRMPTEIPVFLPGSGVVPFNIVPIDYVVDAAWILAYEPAASGRTFHLTDPNPVSAKQAFELLADIANRPAPRFGTLIAGFARRVVGQTRLGHLMPFARVLLGDLTQHVTYDCSGVLELLAPTGVRCPPFDAYADALVIWMANLEKTRRR
ncbi:MAG: SDR family oxidoreductase [Myxococcota bacterium]|nr:SDR family oxidoreductase [Myxococcota bacterium]